MFDLTPSILLKANYPIENKESVIKEKSEMISKVLSRRKHGVKIYDVKILTKHENKSISIGSPIEKDIEIHLRGIHPTLTDSEKEDIETTYRLFTAELFGSSHRSHWDVAASFEVSATTEELINLDSNMIEILTPANAESATNTDSLTKTTLIYKAYPDSETTVGQKEERRFEPAPDSNNPNEPFLKLHTNFAVKDKESLLSELSALFLQTFSEQRDEVRFFIRDNESTHFGGEGEPPACVHIAGFCPSLSDSQIFELKCMLKGFLQRQLGVKWKDVAFAIDNPIAESKNSETTLDSDLDICLDFDLIEDVDEEG